MSEGCLATCAECNGRCCAHYLVPIAGYDVWRIVTGQRLAPELFVEAIPEDQPSANGFRLRATGTSYTLALRHQFVRRGVRPCVFLVKLRDGYQRCGIYNQRPMVCQAYPMQLTADSIAPRSDMLCPPRSWDVGVMDVARWRKQLIEMEIAWALYERVVRCWNETFQHEAAQNERSLASYFTYLVTVYDQLELLRAIPDDDLYAIVDAWPAQSTSTWQCLLATIDTRLADILNKP